MTATRRRKYKKPEAIDHGPRLKPSEVVGSLLLVNVKELREGIKTTYSANATAIALDIASVETGNVALDQLWFNAGIVDPLKEYIGEVIGIRLSWATPAGDGHPYITVDETSDDDDEAIAQFADANPDIFDAPEGAAAPAPEPSKKAPAPAKSKARW